MPHPGTSRDQQSPQGPRVCSPQFQPCSSPGANPRGTAAPEPSALAPQNQASVHQAMELPPVLYQQVAFPARERSFGREGASVSLPAPPASSHVYKCLQNVWERWDMWELGMVRAQNFENPLYTVPLSRSFGIYKINTANLILIFFKSNSKAILCKGH